MKVLITGAHFTPAQAVIWELKNYPDVEIVYLGRKYTREGDNSVSVESQELPKLNVKFIPITTGRLQRNLNIYTFLSLLKLPVGFIQSFYYLVKERPNVILSFGGYVSVPVVICGWLLSIPVIVHEQTLVMGLANSISSFFADKIAVSFEENSGKKTIVTGNPIRQELVDEVKPDNQIKSFIESAKKQKLPVVFITGGNQGSHVINEKIGEALDELTQRYFVIHQTGDSKFKDFEKLQDISNSLSNKERYMVTKWVDVKNMGYLLRNINFCISRAGINTLLELALFKVPTLVVPIPYIYKNEQVVNSKFFEKKGLCKILYQKDLTAQNLLSSLELLKDHKVSDDVVKLIKTDAAKVLALETITLALSNEV